MGRLGTNALRKEQGGIGLGLCLSCAVVQEHRGLLYLDEMAASGACFIVQLPSAEHAGGVRTAQPKPEPGMLRIRPPARQEPRPPKMGFWDGDYSKNL